VILHILLRFCFASLRSILNTGLVFFCGTGCFAAQRVPARPTGEDLHCSPGSCDDKRLLLTEAGSERAGVSWQCSARLSFGSTSSPKGHCQPRCEGSSNPRCRGMFAVSIACGAIDPAPRMGSPSPKRGDGCWVLLEIQRRHRPPALWSSTERF